MPKDEWIHSTDGFARYFVGVKRAPTHELELHVHYVWGSHQEESGRIERSYRAGNFDQLLREAVSAVGSDADFSSTVASNLADAMRQAVFDAQQMEFEENPAVE